MNQSGISKWTVFAAIAGTAFALFHFTCTLIYSVEELPVPDTAKAVTQRYMVPYFHQGWKLFAPDVPALQYELQYRYPDTASQSWREWEDAEQMPQINNHPRVEYIAQKMMIYLSKDLRKNLYYNEDSTINYSLVVDDAPYLRVLYYAVRRHEMIHQNRPDSLQLKFSVRYTPSFRDSVKTEDQDFIFPVYHFAK